jgi:hypothetical protein
MFPRKASQVFRICTSIYSQQGVSGARLADMLPPRCRKSKMLGTQKASEVGAFDLPRSYFLTQRRPVGAVYRQGRPKPPPCRATT